MLAKSVELIWPGHDLELTKILDDAINTDEGLAFKNTRAAHSTVVLVMHAPQASRCPFARQREQHFVRGCDEPG